jgi:small subunit ribosomal protein S5
MKAKKQKQQQADNFVEKLVCVLRTSKTVSGGRRFSFTGVIVIGDGKGKVGFGRGKALEVPIAIQKATENARKNMRTYQLKGTTIQHEIYGSHGASKVYMQPASDGTGLIAGSAMRAVFEVLGVENVLAKIIGSSNPVNVVQATLNALDAMLTPERVAAKRGKKVAEIIGRE